MYELNGNFKSICFSSDSERNRGFKRGEFLQQTQTFQKLYSGDTGLVFYGTILLLNVTIKVPFLHTLINCKFTCVWTQSG